MFKNSNSQSETLAASQEGTLDTELFLQDNYLFRRNMLSGKIEFATLPCRGTCLQDTHPTGVEQHHHPCQARGSL